MDGQWTPYNRSGIAGHQQGASMRLGTSFPTPSSSAHHEPQELQEHLDDFDRSLLGLPPRNAQRLEHLQPISTVASAICNAGPGRGPQAITEAESRFFTPQPSARPINLQAPPPPTYIHSQISEPFDGQNDPFAATSVRMCHAPKITANGCSPTLQRLQRRHKASQISPSLQKSKSNHHQIHLDHAPPMVNGIPLLSPGMALPDMFKHIFPYEVFNAVQSKCFPTVYGSTDNLVVSAPTGSGKTAILELAICKLIVDQGFQNSKIIYQAPTRALCWERAKDWESKFGPLNIHCAELTGDTSRTDMARVRNATIIVTTPEKWDSVTRKWEDRQKLLQLVRLFLIDEVHILKDSRGATLEAVVSRMKTIGAKVRFVALSATVPNSEDIATWLGRDHSKQHLAAHRETFGEEMRPVKLEKIVYGSDGRSMNPYAFDKALDSKLRQAIQTHSEGKPTMVFCFTRKSCQSTAIMLANMWTSFSPEDKTWPQPTQKIIVANPNLQNIIKFGVAFHHAGLDAPDRQAVEKGFLSGQVSVICCTTTLAVGVNLPCHTVILKGTIGYVEGKLQEYSDIEVMQMLGRAGRPQFDTSARGIILTTRNNEERYQKTVSGQEVIESTLHKNLVGHLNSEIVLQTIRDIPSAKSWLKGTFLYVRMRQNPTYYGILRSMDVETVDAKIEEICERDIARLQEPGLVSNGVCFHTTEYGRAMARYMIEFETMKTLLDVPRGVAMKDLLKSLCHGAEFQDLRFRAQERATLRQLNKAGTVLFPIKDNLSEPWTKAFLLVQVALGGVELPNDKGRGLIKKDLAMETSMILERLRRLVRCIIDCKVDDNDAIGTRVAMELYRSLAARCWDGLSTELLQIPSLGPVSMRKLASQGINSLRELSQLDPPDMERLLSRNPPFGITLRGKLKSFPRLTLHGAIVGRAPSRSPGQSSPSAMIRVILGYANGCIQPSWPGNKAPQLTLAAETTDGTLRFFWRDSIRKVDGQCGLELKFPVTIDTFTDEVLLSFSCEEVVGTEVTQQLIHDIPRHQFPPEKVCHDQGGLKPSRPTEQETQPTKFHEEFTDPNISDQDLLGLLGSDVELAIDDRTHVDDQSGVFPPIVDGVVPQDSRLERIVQEGGEEEIAEKGAVRLPNGRWRCNHPCSSGVITRNGKSCTHKCCRDGLDRPRQPRSRRKRPSSADPEEKGRQKSAIRSKKIKNSNGDACQTVLPGRQLPLSEANKQGQKTIDYVDLSLLSDDEEVEGHQLDFKSVKMEAPNRVAHQMGGPFQATRDIDCQRQMSVQSSHYDSEVFDELPDLDHLVSSSKAKNRQKSSSLEVGKEGILCWPEHHEPDGRPDLYMEDIKAAAVMSGRHSSPTPQPELSERQPSRSRLVDMVSDDEDMDWDPACPLRRRRQKETKHSMDSGDYKVNATSNGPAWLADIDPWVVDLLKGSGEFAD